MVVCTTLTSASPASDKTTDLCDTLWDFGVNIRASTILVRRIGDEHLWISNPERARQGFVPAATSDIPHTLVALETGIAAPDTAVSWDGVTGFADAWNRDQTLTAAFKSSSVRVYQDIVRSVGHAEMTWWLRELSYGNQMTGAPSDLTTYWLRGPLEISALEQIAFLSRLVSGDLPLSPRTFAQAKEVMLAESRPGCKVFAKTGWGLRGRVPDIGWCVGWVERDRPKTETYVFAFNLDMISQTDWRKREETVQHVLTKIGALPKNSWR